jgi:hypothetical protein
MRTHRNIRSFSKSPWARFLSATAVIAAAAMTIEDVRADIQSDPKPYTLFMGADFAVALNAESYPVWDVSGNSWVIKVKGQQVLVSTKGAPIQVRTSPGLKVTEVSASIENMKTERSFSAGNDPYTKFTMQTNRAASDMFESQSATDLGNAMTTEATVVGLRLAGPQNGNVPIVGDPNANGFEGGGKLANLAAHAVAGANVAAGASPGMAVGANAAVDTESYDAMDVRFDVSAGKPLDHPYVVLVGRYRGKNGSSGAIRNWISAQALGRIDSNPAKIHILTGGLPRGFESNGIELHLYNDGQEVATNISSKRVQLTRDDAFEYVKMDYVSNHKGATLPAVPAMGNLPADLPSRLAGGQYSQPFYVKVSKDGLAARAYVDEACSQPVNDSYIDAVIRNIRFNPALDEGKPVEGVVTLKLGQLVI